MIKITLFFYIGGYGGYGYPQRSSGSSFLGFGSGLGIGNYYQLF